MDEPQDACALTDEEQHLLTLLRHGPQSVMMVAQALFQRLDRHVGLVRLLRYDTLRYGLAE
jgi:hypothetical protein